MYIDDIADAKDLEKAVKEESITVITSKILKEKRLHQKNIRQQI